jgi:hypothetical protein
VDLKGEGRRKKGEEKPVRLARRATSVLVSGDDMTPVEDGKIRGILPDPAIEGSGSI